MTNTNVEYYVDLKAHKYSFSPDDIVSQKLYYLPSEVYNLTHIGKKMFSPHNKIVRNRNSSNSNENFTFVQKYSDPDSLCRAITRRNANKNKHLYY